MVSWALLKSACLLSSSLPAVPHPLHCYFCTVSQACKTVWYHFMQLTRHGNWERNRGQCAVLWTGYCSLLCLIWHGFPESKPPGAQMDSTASFTKQSARTSQLLKQMCPTSQAPLEAVKTGDPCSVADEPVWSFGWKCRRGYVMGTRLGVQAWGRWWRDGLPIIPGAVRHMEQPHMPHTLISCVRKGKVLQFTEFMQAFYLGPSQVYMDSIYDGYYILYIHLCKDVCVFWKRAKYRDI